MKMDGSIIESFLCLPRSERESVKKLLDDTIKDQVVKFELSEQKSNALQNEDKNRREKIKQKFSKKFANALINFSDQSDFSPTMCELIENTIAEYFPNPHLSSERETLS